MYVYVMTSKFSWYMCIYWAISIQSMCLLINKLVFMTCVYILTNNCPSHVFTYLYTSKCSHCVFIYLSAGVHDMCLYTNQYVSMMHVYILTSMCLQWAFSIIDIIIVPFHFFSFTFHPVISVYTITHSWNVLKSMTKW